MEILKVRSYELPIKSASYRQLENYNRIMADQIKEYM